MFNLNFKLHEPHELSLEFLLLLYQTYNEHGESASEAR